MARDSENYCEAELRAWLHEHLKSIEFSGSAEFLDDSKELRGLLRSGEALCLLVFFCVPFRLFLTDVGCLIR